MTEKQAQLLAAALSDVVDGPRPIYVIELRQAFLAEATASTESPITTTADLGEPATADLESEARDGDTLGGTPGPQPGRRWWSRPMNVVLAAAAVALIAMVATVGIMATQGDEETNDVQIFGSESALSTTAAYFAAVNSGNLDAALALFTGDATFSDTDNAQTARPDWEPRLAWDLAQGRRHDTPACEVEEEDPGISVTVVCLYGSHDEVARAAGLTTPLRSTITVTPAGISDRHETYGYPTYFDIGMPFNRWLERNHIEDAFEAGCCQGSTVDEAIQRGELRRAYAREWAAFLEENDCTYNQGC